MKELLILSGLGVASLILEIINLRKLILPIIMLGLIACIVVCIFDFNNPENVYDMLFVDNSALIITIILCFTTLCWFAMNLDEFYQNEKILADF